MHKARYYRRPDGLALGPGPFVAALEYATGREAEAVGKPEREFFLSALEGLDCQPEEAVMIGDVSWEVVLVKCGRTSVGVCSHWRVRVDFWCNFDVSS